MYIIVYGTNSNENRSRLESELLRRFSSGASIKEGVYLIPEQNRIEVKDIVNVLDSKLSDGDTVYISRLDKPRAYRGYPQKFRDWLKDKQ